MLRRNLESRASRAPKYNWNIVLATRHVKHLGGRVDNLISGKNGKIERHELDDWTQSDHRRADAEPGKTKFGDRRIDNAFLPQLVEQALVHAAAAKIDTVFVRPQGLDRVWVRLGFIPVPEAELTESFRGRPGIGLFGWRGGSALWSAAARGRDRRTSPAFR